MHTYMHTLAYMHTCTSICMQAKPRCMNAHMHAFMYVATLYSWLCLCVLGHMYTAQPTYIHKEVFYPTQLHIPQGRGRGIIRWPITMEWGWGALARRICIYVLCTYIYVYIYIYMHMSSDVLVSAGPRTMKIQLHLLVSQTMMT